MKNLLRNNTLNFGKLVMNGTMIVLSTFIFLFFDCHKKTTPPLETDTTNLTNPNGVPNDSLYQVWLNTAIMPENAISTPGTWSNTASTITGLIVNLSSLKSVPGSISQNETPVTNWSSFFPLLKSAQTQCLIPYPRSATINSIGIARRDIRGWLTDAFQKAQNLGYQINTIMLYNDCQNGDCSLPPYTWTSDSAQFIRTWLNANNHSSVKLGFTVPRFKTLAENILWINNPLFESIMMEGNPSSYGLKNGIRDSILQYFHQTGLLRTKSLVLTFPLENVPNPLGIPSAYQRARWVLQHISSTYGVNFLRTSHLIFSMSQYSYGVPFYPEMINSNKYNNSLTGVALSLIEQRNYFEGFKGSIDSNFVNSYTRTITP